jgi:hypothetical protein
VRVSAYKQDKDKFRGQRRAPAAPTSRPSNDNLRQPGPQLTPPPMQPSTRVIDSDEDGMQWLRENLAKLQVGA